MGTTLALLVRLAISMAVVMGVMGLAARLVRRRQGFGGPGPAKAGARPGGHRVAGRSSRSRRARPEPPFEVLYRRSLSKGSSLALVQANGRQYLLGVTEQAVSLVADLSAQPQGAATFAPADGAGGGAAFAPGDGGTPTGTGTLGAPAPISLDDIDNWGQTGRMPVSLAEAVAPGQPATAWKLAIDSLRERTVRR